MERGLAYAFATLVCVPLMLAIVNFLFFRGNQVTQEQVTEYINDSKVIEVFIPEVAPGDEAAQSLKRLNIEFKSSDKDSTHVEHDIYYPKMARGGSKVMNRFRFYSEKYDKYLVLINFDGFDYGGPFDLDLNDDRNRVVWSEKYFIVRANNKQWNDANYGTKKNPVPVFGVTLSGRGYENTDPEVLVVDKNMFDVSNEVNRIFVGQYLDHFLLHDEFKRLFSS